MIIKNKQDLALTPMREQVLELIEAGIISVLPKNLIKPILAYNEKLNTITIARVEYNLIKGRIFIIGGGKASGKMAESLEKIIGADNISAGAVNTVKDKYQTDKIKIIKAEHPLPGRKGVIGVRKMLELKEKFRINEKDLVICLISGGGSALLPAPVAGVSLGDERILNDLLIRSGADIKEINTVRKHISRVKGGQLAKYFSPAQVASLIISDVVGNDLSIIASGPTVPDPTTFNDARIVLDKYDLTAKIPASILNYIKLGCDNRVKDTPKELINANNYIIGKNVIALEAMAHKAKEFNLNPLIVTNKLAGETKATAERIIEEIKTGKHKDYNVLIYGGETTPKVADNTGKGGRNQHFTAVAILALADLEKDWLVASVSTDGEDFNTGVAGALVDKLSLESARKNNLNIKSYLDSFDTFNLFKGLGKSQVIIGSTGTNVGDVAIITIK